MSNESPARILYDENGNRVGVSTNPLQVTGFVNPSSVGITGPVRVDRVGITGFVQVTGPIGIAGQVDVVGVVGITGPVRVDQVGITGPVRVDRVGITGPVGVTGIVGVTGTVRIMDSGGTAFGGVPSFPFTTDGPFSSRGAPASVSAATGSTQLLASNVLRAGATVFNDSASAVLYLLLGTPASTTSYTVQVRPRSYYEVPYGYQGVIAGIWNGATGAARVTELT